MNTPTMYQAIEENFREDYKNLLRSARNKLGDLWAEDCVQDTYEAVLKAAPRLHNQYDIKYLMRAALFNRIKDYMSDRIDAEEIEEEHIYGGDVEEKWKALNLAGKAIKLIDVYPEPVRTGLYLHIMEGVSLREVVRIVGVSRPTITKHSNYIRGLLEGE